jgi:hypothetical protein
LGAEKTRSQKNACLHLAAGTGENAAESPASSAPMMMASDHFMREDENVRPENALLARFLLESDAFQ